MGEEGTPAEEEGRKEVKERQTLLHEHEEQERQNCKLREDQ